VSVRPREDVAPAAPAATVGAFGAGDGEPYRRLLADPRDGALSLRSLDGASTVHRLDAGGWVRSATPADLTTLDGATGPVLDVGCGSGRMVRAAAARGLPVLGIDIAPHAIERTRVDGSLALIRSVFDRVPLEGRWQTILLLDGNVGIGGEPSALLERCRQLLDEGGSIVVEVDADAELAAASLFTVVDDDGNESDAFPWARVGWAAAARFAERAGLAVVDHWVADGRHFVRAAPVGRSATKRDRPFVTFGEVGGRGR
jgi:SAM-dependent methyltransferase